ncbi:SpoIIE family protein phosphatase [Aquabacter sp. P-9]|uniref:SpoIIE family protein phosphatase n=1 Tax=Aquabacter sediminis TaxID=3029197 RepID=UPI00237EAB43|nr:SpoIIE family protein phosphatase [Aquabacter sp. P-9]MDE1568522.1 SpoIIE family protein phosphatase [Aquabacter sp. P-9]
MLLRTRITLLVGIGFVSLCLAFLVASFVRDRLEHGRSSQIAISLQGSLWTEIVEAQVSDLDQILAEMEASSFAMGALGVGDRERVLQELKELGYEEDIPNLALEVVDQRRDVTFSLGDAFGRGILDAGALDRALSGRAVGGLRSVSATEILVVASRTLTLPGRGSVVVVLARDARVAVNRFASSLGAVATLVSLRGRTVDTSDEVFWRQADLAVSPRVPLYEQVVLGPRTYSMTTIPVDDLAGSIVGAVVSLKDETAEWEAQSLLRRTAIFISLALVVFGLIGLYTFLWYSFRPLENAIEVLQALSRGDTSVTLDRTGADEIGRIAQAVVGLRANAQALTESRRQRERVRRRQEAVISTELKALADAIDPTDREEVLALLARPEASEGDDELRRVARVLHDLSRRIVEQYTRLSSMVVELREALITKTKLAGLQQELEIARQVQLAILPKEFPPDPRVMVDGHMTPAREVGGDFYDYFFIDRSTLGFVVADVSGKGVPAALFMAISRTLLRSTAMFERSPSSSVRRLNDLLAVENDQMLFVTLFYGVIDLDTGRCTYVNAGHNPPYRISREGKVEALPTTKGMAVAVMEGFVYAEREIQLEPGDTLVLFTDGVTEAFDIDDEPYGEKRLEALLASGIHERPVPQVENDVLASIRAFERGAPQADDITLLTLRYFGGHGPRITH